MLIINEQRESSFSREVSTVFLSISHETQTLVCLFLKRDKVDRRSIVTSALKKNDNTFYLFLWKPSTWIRTLQEGRKRYDGRKRDEQKGGNDVPALELGVHYE